MRLIDADALKSVPIPIGYIGEKAVGAVQTAAIGAVLKAIDKTIDDAPTIDAVPVVRGECAKQFMPDCPLQIIEKHERRFICQKDDDFCSYGEKTEDKLCQDRT